MEKQLAQLQEELAAAPVRKATSSVDWIPRPPEKFTLTGHRSPLTRVVFHPVFSLLGAFTRATCHKTRETGRRAVSCLRPASPPDAFLPLPFPPHPSPRSLPLPFRPRPSPCSLRTLPHIPCPAPPPLPAVTCSEDATVKIWDYETGDFERTLKGHTNAVQDAAYDGKGHWLGTRGGSRADTHRSRTW